VLTLFDHPRSGNCYKVRLFLALHGIRYVSRYVDVLGRANRSPAYAAVNPFCQVPTLQDGDDLIWDSQAILCHLAARHAPHWLPQPGTRDHARVQQWLSVSSNEIANSLQPLRLVHIVGIDEAAHHLGVAVESFDLAGCIARSERLLSVMDAHLADHGPWLACPRPTVADIACYGYVCRAHEARIDLAAQFPAVAAWAGRIAALPGYLGMEASAHPT